MQTTKRSKRGAWQPPEFESIVRPTWSARAIQVHLEESAAEHQRAEQVAKAQDAMKQGGYGTCKIELTPK